MATELVFNARVDTGNSAEAVGALNVELSETEQLTEQVSKEGSKSMQSVGQAADQTAKALKNPQTELRQMLSDLARIEDQGSPEFQALAREAGALQDRINNATAAIRTMSSDFPALEVGVQAMASIGAAAQGATAAQALFGSENEDVARSIQKLVAIQGLMNSVQVIANNLSDEAALGQKLRALRTQILTAANAQHVAGVTTATTAQRILNFVMNKNPVFVLITAFTALAAAIAVFAASSKDARTQQELLNEAQDESLATIGEETAKLDDLTAVLKSETASRNQKREAIEELNKAYPEFLGNIDLEKATQEELNEAIEKQTKLITLQAEAKALAAIKADLFKEKIELELEATREATGAWVMFTDAIGAGTARQIADDGKRQERIGTLKEEIESINSATEANREEASSLLGSVDAREFLLGVNDALSKQQEQAAKDAKKRAKEIEANRKKASAERQKDEDAAAKEEADATAKANALALEADKLFGDLLITNIKDVNVRKRTELLEDQRREREDLKAKFVGDTALLEELKIKQAAELLAVTMEIDEEESNRKNADNKARLEAELLRLQEDSAAMFEKRQELFELEREQELQNKELTEGEKLLIEEEFNQKSKALKDEAAAQDKERQEKIAEASKKTFEQGLGAIQNLSDSVFAIKKNNLEKGSAAELKAAKQQFKVNKAIALSSAVLSGITGLQNILSAKSLLPEPAASIQKGVTAGLFVATSLANIAKISSAKFQGGAGGGGGTSVGAPSVPAPPSPDIPDETGDFGDGNTTLTGGDQGTTQAAPMRVAVVDSDIKVALDNSERVEVTSSIG